MTRTLREMADSVVESNREARDAGELTSVHVADAYAAGIRDLLASRHDIDLSDPHTARVILAVHEVAGIAYSDRRRFGEFAALRDYANVVSLVALTVAERHGGGR